MNLSTLHPVPPPVLPSLSPEPGTPAPEPVARVAFTDSHERPLVPAMRSRPPRKLRRKHRTSEAQELEPTLLVVGESAVAAEVILAATVRLGTGQQVQDLPEALGRANEATIGFVLVAPGSQPEAVDFVEAQLEMIGASPDCAELHRFVVVEGSLEGPDARRLYAAGASSIFVWTIDRTNFADLLIDLLGVPSREFRRDNIDRSIGRSVRARIRLWRDQEETIRASVRRGIAILSGAVVGLERREQLRNLLRSVPGVRQVLMKRLHGSSQLDGSVEANRALERQVQHRLAALGSAAGDLVVQARVDVVRIEGSVPSPAISRRISWLVSDLSEVAKVENKTRVERKKSLSRILSALNRKIRERFPTARVELTPDASKVRLRGFILRAEDRRELSELCKANIDVPLLTDQLQVGRGGGMR